MEASAARSGGIAAKFARNLARLRKQAGLSQEELGLESVIHPTWISHLESGTVCPSLLTVAKLAHALGIEVAPLVEGLGWRPVDVDRQLRPMGESDAV